MFEPQQGAGTGAARNRAPKRPEEKAIRAARQISVCDGDAELGPVFVPIKPDVGEVHCVAQIISGRTASVSVRSAP